MKKLKKHLITKIEKMFISAAEYHCKSSSPSWIYEVPKPDNLPEMLRKVKKEMEEEEKNN